MNDQVRDIYSLMLVHHINCLKHEIYVWEY